MTNISLIRESPKSHSLKVQNGIKLITETREFSCLSKFQFMFREERPWMRKYFDSGIKAKPNVAFGS